MGSFNRVLLLGNLTRDPQLSYTPSNTPVCEFGLATNYRYKDRDGEMKEEVCFVNLTAYGRRAETINQYMSKGRPIFIEGRLRYQQWTNQEGQKRSKLDVVVENFTFVGGGGGGGGGGGPSGGRPAERASAPSGDEPPPPADLPPGDNPDIPF